MALTTPVYLDNNATTPLDPRVFDAMKPFFLERFGNAASRHHSLGRDAADAVESARKQVANLIGADPREIVFTSGATESVNLAIKGVAASGYYAARGKHLVTVATEHKAVLDCCEYLESREWDVTYLPVDRLGLVDLDELAEAITEQTVMVAIMHANNETGVLQPIETIGPLCKKRGVLFLTDATQSVGRLPVDVQHSGIDLLAMSAHKMHGPKGVGAIFVRRRGPRVRCEPLMHGGGHERGLRSGTMNVPGIVGLGVAAAICNEEMAAENDRIGSLRDALERSLCEKITGVAVNGCVANRLANTTNLSFADIDSEALMANLSDVAVSASAACTSASMQASYVLGAMGLGEEAISGSVRFSLGRFSSMEEINYAVDRIVVEVKKLRSQAPPQAKRCALD